MTAVLDQPALGDVEDLAASVAVPTPGTLPDTEPAEAHGATDEPEASADVREAGLRALEGHDWIVAACWGLVYGVVTAAVSLLLLPVQFAGIALVLGAGLGVLGWLDHLTQLIRNRHTLAFGVLAAAIVAGTQASVAQGIVLPALIGAAAAFVFMLSLTVVTGIIVGTGFAGGGDIKLSPVPAGLLAAISPLAAMLWLLFTFVLALGAMIATRLSGNRRRRTAMAPLMAVAAVLAVAGYGLLARALGI